MRVACLAFALVGCAGWRTVPANSIDHESRAMVFTEHTAFELEDARQEADTVIGTRVHAWHITTCSYDPTADPSEIARSCGWREERSDQKITIERSAIRNVHVRRVDRLAVGTIMTFTVVFSILVYGFTRPSDAQHI